MADLYPLAPEDYYLGEEMSLAAAGLCGYIVEQAADGSVSYCREPSVPASPFRWCAGHDEEDG